MPYTLSTETYKNLGTAVSGLKESKEEEVNKVQCMSIISLLESAKQEVEVSTLHPDITQHGCEEAMFLKGRSFRFFLNNKSENSYLYMKL